MRWTIYLLLWRHKLFLFLRWQLYVPASKLVYASDKKGSCEQKSNFHARDESGSKLCGIEFVAQKYEISNFEKFGLWPVLAPTPSISPSFGAVKCTGISRTVILSQLLSYYWVAIFAQYKHRADKLRYVPIHRAYYELSCF